jgi:hypothetical protein
MKYYKYIGVGPRVIGQIQWVELVQTEAEITIIDNMMESQGFKLEAIADKPGESTILMNMPPGMYPVKIKDEWIPQQEQDFVLDGPTSEVMIDLMSLPPPKTLKDLVGPRRCAWSPQHLHQ